jgi:predicted RNA-binding Zn-ribbon protein involved in translation (DUF1610 family)
MPRRPKTNILDDLFDLLMDIPWWAGPIVIFGVYASFRWVFAWMLGPITQETDVSKISYPILSQAVVNIAPYAAGLAALVWVVALLKKAGQLDKSKEPSPDANGPSPSPSQSTGRGISAPTEDSNVTCPQCGSPMVLRTAKKGENAGSQFWGCSRFPGCRGTRARSRWS